jgi:hypothetical protein
MKLFKILFAILCLICLLDYSYDFYEVFRYVALGSFIFLSIKEKDKHGWMALWITSALLVQPFLKPDIDQETWYIIDVAWALLLIISLVTVKKQDLNVSVSYIRVRKFFAREFLILLSGLIAYGLVVLYSDYKYEQIENYNWNKNIEIVNEIESISSIIDSISLERENISYTYKTYKYLQGYKDGRVSEGTYSVSRGREHELVKPETFESFAKKIENNQLFYFTSQGKLRAPSEFYENQRYIAIIRNAINERDEKFKNRTSYSEFAKSLRKCLYDCWKEKDDEFEVKINELVEEKKIIELSKTDKPNFFYRYKLKETSLEILFLLLYGTRLLYLFFILIKRSIKLLSNNN